MEKLPYVYWRSAESAEALRRRFIGHCRQQRGLILVALVDCALRYASLASHFVHAGRFVSLSYEYPGSGVYQRDPTSHL